MPRFSEAQITPADLDSIARYVELTKHPEDAGGFGIGHIGPVPEGLVAWLAALAALLLVARLIGERVDGDESKEPR
jgi:ubiquinol-cytochrome c reductase cytochrome c subunit